jgi:GNAT superfamily N-acetyltransferase
MEIVPYEPDLAPAVADAYNRLTVGLHHCYRTTAERVATVMEPAPEGDEGDGRLHDDHAWVALEHGEVAAFAHAVLQEPTDEDPAGRGLIRFLAYEPGRRAVGQALLEAVEAHLAEREVPQIVAFHQDHMWPIYHFTHAYLSDRLNHVHALLEQNGYRRSAGEVFLDWPDFDPPDPHEAPVEFELRRKLLPGETQRPSFALLAFHGEEQIAECWNASCGDRAPGSGAEDWCLTTWLHVEEPHRGQRLGAHLLALALAGMKTLGYRHAAISTSWTNHRAQLFYSNFGYHTSDWTYALSKTP